MTIDFPILRGRYLEDILHQPTALGNTVAGLARTPVPRLTPHRFVLTAMGGSLHALHVLQAALVRGGLTSAMIETSELIYSQPGWLDERTALIVVSQSGRSAEIVTLLDRVKGRAGKPTVIGVTNTPGSPLASRADHVVLTEAGEEATVSCKTFLATLAALEWLGAELTGGARGEVLAELEKAGPAVGEYLAGLNSHVREIVPLMEDVRHLFVTGRGRSLAPVGTGGLILKESAHTHAEGMSCPAFRHGPMEMTHPGLLAVVMEGDAETAELNRNLARDIVAATGRAVLVGEDAPLAAFRLPKAPARVRPILEMLPVQAMSLALGVRANRTPGVFERIAKVTDTE